MQTCALPIAFTTKLFVSKELDIRGSRNATEEDFCAVIEAIRSGVVQVDHVVTQRYSIDEVDRALSFWRNAPQDVTKILLET